MKKKQNVSINQVRKHLEAKGIDEQEFFTSKTEEEKKALSEVFYAFTGLNITPEGAISEHEGKEGKILIQKHESFDSERFYQVQNMEQFVELINVVIDVQNEADKKKDLALEILGDLSEEDRTIQNIITARALGHLENINAIRKERELNIADINRESLEAFSDFNTMIKALSRKAEERYQELHNLDNHNPNQELER